MDFLDPDKMRRHVLMVFVGYVLIGVAIFTAAIILLYQSTGIGIDDEGKVIQNTLVFTATTPSGADILLDGKDMGYKTDKRLVLPAGEFVLQYKKQGYTPWSRQVSTEGGSVNRYDYAFLFPTALDTRLVKQYTTDPILSTQSPDHRWYFVQLGTDIRQFDVYDLKNPLDPAEPITVPRSILTVGKKESWKFIEWSNDNVHVLMQHVYGKKTEYILINRESPAESVNLTKSLGINPTELRLLDKKYDKYLLFDAKAKTLRRATLRDPTPVSYLKNVLAFKSYGDNVVLFVTDDVKQTSGGPVQVAAKMASGDQTYTIRKMTPGNEYLLELTRYSGDLIVGAGSDAEDKLVVYRNPIDQIKDPNLNVAVQVATLRTNNPDYVSFSENTRFLMIENGSHFALYDAETEKTYAYDTGRALDKPQEHASWMDGHRMQYVSKGQLVIFDYDHTNVRQLLGAAPAYLPGFTPDYKRLFTVSPQQDNPEALRVASTWLLTQTDR